MEKTLVRGSVLVEERTSKKRGGETLERQYGLLTKIEGLIQERDLKRGRETNFRRKRYYPLYPGERDRGYGL